MRRTLAGLLFGLAAACAGVSVAGFLLNRTAFEPNRSAAAADVVLADPAIRHDLVVAIADPVSAALLKTAPSEPAYTQQNVRARVAAVAATREGARLLAKIIHDAHARLIGDRNGPVPITPQQLVDATQMQAAADVPTVVLEVPRVGVLAVAHTTLRWLVPLAALATVSLVAIALAAHPGRSALFKTLGLGMLMLALMVLVVGYVVPRFAIPAMSSSAWAAVPARLADDSTELLAVVELLLVGGGLALLASTGAMRRRRGWSTPVSTYRYQEERRWSG